MKPKLPQIISIVAIVISAAAIALYFIKGSNVAYVDTNVIFQKYEGMKKAKADYEQKASAMQANADSLLKGWQKELMDYEKERKSMTARERELKEQLLQNKQQQLGGYQEATKKRMQEEEQKLTQTVVNEINDYITEYGKKHGYKYILGANGSGSLLYADKTEDITEEVLKGLNEEYSK